MYELEILAADGCVRTSTLEHGFERPHHQRERRSEFMADVAEESCFGAIKFREGFCSLLRLFVSVCFRDRSRDMPSDQFEKCAIRLIEPFARTDTGENVAYRSRLAWKDDG